MVLTKLDGRGAIVSAPWPATWATGFRLLFGEIWVWYSDGRNKVTTAAAAAAAVAAAAAAAAACTATITLALSLLLLWTKCHICKYHCHYHCHNDFLVTTVQLWTVRILPHTYIPTNYCV